MAQKKSIDEIWKELNARPAPRRPAAAANGSSTSSTSSGASKGGALTIPGLGTITRVPPPPKATLTLDTAMAEDVPLGGSSSSKAHTYDPMQAGVTPEQLSTYLSTIQRLVNCLSDTDRGTRRQACVALQAKLVSGDATTPAASPAMLQALACGPLLHPLLQLLKDVVEKCRAVSMELWAHIVSHVPDLSPLLPALLPELAHRMGHLPVQETAEEVRLALVQLVGVLVGRAPPGLLLPGLPDLLLIMCRAQEDSFHEIKKAGCAALVGVCRAVPGPALAPHTAKLLPALVANLSHPHSRVRTAALEALDALVMAGGLGAGALQEVLAPGLRHVAYDRAPGVRETLFSSLARWLGAPAGPAPAPGAQPPLPQGGPAAPAAAAATPAAGEAAAAGGDTLQAGASAAHGSSPQPPPQQQQQQVGPGQFTELLPILLVGVSDPQPSVATLSLQLVEAVGDAFQQQVQGQGSGSGAGNSMQVDTDAAAATAVLPGGDDTPMGENPAPASDGAVDIQAAVAACQLGAPYSGRPGAGARGMARCLLPRLLPPVVADLTSWTVAQRGASVRSLHTLLVLAEDAAQAHLPALLGALVSAVGDEDVEVAGGVVRALHVVGAHVPPARWVPLMLDTLINTRLSSGARANALVMLAALEHAAGSAQQPLPGPLLVSLATTLASDELRGTLLVAASASSGAHTATQLAAHGAGPAPAVMGREAAATRAQLLAVTSNLLRWQGAACQAVSKPLATLLLALWGAELPPEPQPAAAAASVAVGASLGAGLGGRAAVEAAMQQLVVCCGGAAAGSAEGGSSWEGLLDRHADVLLQEVLSCMNSWSPDSGGYLVLRALLLTAGPTSLARVTPALLAALRPLLCDHDGQPALRLAVLQLLDAVLDDPQGRGRGLAGEAHALQLLESVLLPPLTWRAGKTAAAIRYAAITALASALRRGLLPRKPVLRLVDDGSLLPLLAQELDEDWYVDVRHAACYVVQQLLQLVGLRLGHEPRRTLYVELLKRLDDSNNTVRIAACQALHTFCTTMPPDYCETNAGYLAAGVVIHMDDADTLVQDAACSVLEALGQVKPGVVLTEVFKVRDRFRNKHCCDRVLASLPAA